MVGCCVFVNGLSGSVISRFFLQAKSHGLLPSQEVLVLVDQKAAHTIASFNYLYVYEVITYKPFERSLSAAKSRQLCVRCPRTDSAFQPAAL